MTACSWQKENRKKWAARKIREAEYTEPHTLSSILSTERNAMLLPGGLCSGMVKVHTERALSKPRSMNTFCFMSEGEQCCSWSYVAIETQEKQSKGLLLYEIDYSLFQGVGQQNTALLCLHIRAAVSVLFQKYSELNKDLLGSFPALFTTIWCGRLCAFWLHFLTAMWEFIYPLTVPIQRNCGQLSWMNLENSWELSLL